MHCDTPSENTGLRHLPNVSSAFKGPIHVWQLLKTNINENLPGNKHWRAIDSIQHCGKRLPLKHTDLRTRVFFLSSFSHNFNDQLSQNVDKVVILYVCWDTPIENTGALFMKPS